jgi:hypothetical protein
VKFWWQHHTISKSKAKGEIQKGNEKAWKIQKINFTEFLMS